MACVVCFHDLKDREPAALLVYVTYGDNKNYSEMVRHWRGDIMHAACVPDSLKPTPELK